MVAEVETIRRYRCSLRRGRRCFYQSYVTIVNPYWANVPSWDPLTISDEGNIGSVYVNAYPDMIWKIMADTEFRYCPITKPRMYLLLTQASVNLIICIVELAKKSTIHLVIPLEPRKGKRTIDWRTIFNRTQ